MPSQEDIQHQQGLLAIHRGNLARLLDQAAMHGGEIFAPTLTANAIHVERANIQQIKAVLREWNIFTENLPLDETPSITTMGNQQPICPYRGMLPFRTQDADLFFGREDEIRDIILRLRHQQLLCIVGPSGSGKTSLILAGILPKLLDGNTFPKDYWCIKQLRPGSQPIQALTKILDGNISQPRQIVNRLLAQNSATQRLLIIVDQFEELFLQSNQEKQKRFIAALKSLRSIDNCTVMIAISADFYSNLKNTSLWPIGGNTQFDIMPLQGGSLQRAITAPAARMGVSLEAGLVTRLLVDAVDEPGALPFLQETIVSLWDFPKKKLLTLEDYERLGYSNGQKGLAAALVMSADEAYDNLSPTQQAIACRIFLRLVQFSEDGMSQNTHLRQPINNLRNDSDDTTIFEQTVQKLSTARLLTLSGDPSGTKQVAIAHQALINSWPKLRDWINDKRSAEKTRRFLDSRVDKWIQLGRSKKHLLNEFQLREAETWLDSSNAIELGYSGELPALVQASQAAIAKSNRGWTRIARRVLIMLAVAGSLVAAGEYADDRLARDAALNEAQEEMMLINGTYGTSDIFRDEISNAQYALCVRAEACDIPQNSSFYKPETRPEEPIVNVSAIQAAEYCQWLGLRLPLEQEWEDVIVISPITYDYSEWTSSGVLGGILKIWSGDMRDKPEYLIVRGWMKEELDITTSRDDLGFRCARSISLR